MGAAAANVGAINLMDVYAGVYSLYDDELKPYGRILRKRLAERSIAGECDVDIRLLQTACEVCSELQVMPEEGGDWSVICKGRPQSFVDVYSPIDAYPPAMWRAAREYFDGLEDAKMVLPGGRYSCAQALASRRLPFLQGLSLGQVCHIVQLAISQKKLLGYLNGAVVPYRRSQSMVKEQCAVRGRPCAGGARGMTMPVATWDAVRVCLQEILNEQMKVSGRTAFIPLSNVKRLFRSKFHVELSETALGHAKLSELLQDERLQDLCAVRLQGHGYVVMPAQQQYRQPQQPPLAPHELMQLQSEQQQPQLPQQSILSAAEIKLDPGIPSQIECRNMRAQPPSPLGDMTCADDTTCTGTSASSEEVTTPENFGSIPLGVSWKSFAEGAGPAVWPVTAINNTATTSCVDALPPQSLPRILGSESSFSPSRRRSIVGGDAESCAPIRGDAMNVAKSSRMVEETAKGPPNDGAWQRVVRLAELV
jgi:hypothetical protein